VYNVADTVLLRDNGVKMIIGFDNFGSAAPSSSDAARLHLPGFQGLS
jgi:hypothetical protein